MTLHKQTFNTNIADDGKNMGRLVAFGVLAILLALFFTLNSNAPKATPGLVPVYQMPFNMSVTADGGTQVRLPTDDIGMPNFPGCFDPDDCEWDAHLRTGEVGGEKTVVVDAALKRGGRVIARVQHMLVETADYEQLAAVAAKGHKLAWISHIKVAEHLWGKGIGKTLWRAGDALLKLTRNTDFHNQGEIVHAFADQAGWGRAILNKIPPEDIVAATDDLFSYIVR